MTLLERSRAYVAHPDPLTAACNRIAMLVAFNQPFYPLYLRAFVGGDWRVACWTFLSTPFFLAVPALSRIGAERGRALLPLTGVVNGIVSAKAFGPASGVELFLLPCLLIALLGFRARSRWRRVAIVAVVAAAGLHFLYGAPLGRFTAEQYRHFVALNLYSVTALSAVILWMLVSARRASARR